MKGWSTPWGQRCDRPIHVYPLNEQHAIDGSPCSCMPRVFPGIAGKLTEASDFEEREKIGDPQPDDSASVVVHNSFDGREVGTAMRKALDLLGKALADHQHTWTAEERDAFCHAMLLANLHWPQEG